MESPLRIYERPRLRNPSLVVGWSDAGHVGTGVVDYLVDKLDAKEFGEIEPYDFSALPVSLVRGGVLDDIEYPASSFHYWKNKRAAADLVLFGSPLPYHGHYEFANLILDVAELFAVKRVYAVGGVPANVAHIETPTLFGVVNSSRLKKHLKQYDVDVNLDYHGPTTMNGLLLGLAKHRGLDGICLYGRVPSYLGEIPNPRVSESILRVLAQMLNIEIDFAEIESEARLANRQIEEIVSYIREQSPEFDRHMGQLEKGVTFERGEEGRKSFFRDIEDFLKRQKGNQEKG